MSDNELRDRIERAILGRTAPNAAQAVIDDLGLTVEWRQMDHGKVAHVGISGEFHVGRWEKK